jgi:hypothetical protein
MDWRIYLDNLKLIIFKALFLIAFLPLRNAIHLLNLITFFSFSADRVAPFVLQGVHWSILAYCTAFPTPSGNNWYRKDFGVGSTSGGLCTCPDGKVFTVGDYNNDCKTLACEGGSAGACRPQQREYPRISREHERERVLEVDCWCLGACKKDLPSQFAGMKVTCGRPTAPLSGVAPGQHILQWWSPNGEYFL